MKTLKLLFLLPLSILSLDMSAQIDDLLRDKDITWVAETYNDFVVDESFESKVGDGKSRATSLKLVNNTTEILEDKYALQKWLMAAVENGKIVAYEDADCRVKINRDSIGNWSMFSVINPYTQKTDYVEKVQRYSFEDIMAFRARQIIYYDSKNAKFGMRTLAVAPIYVRDFYRYDKFPMLPENSPLFWFKPKDLSKAQRLSKTDITWAKHMNFASGISLNEDSIKILKHSHTTKPIDELLKVFENKPRTSFYKREGGLNPSKKISFEDRKKMLWQTDTFRIIDPITYEESYKVINERVQGNEIMRLQLVQNWYWNSQRKRLEIYLLAIAPLKNEAIKVDDFTYFQPLFYRRTDD